jgi:hypothetical protein
MLNKIQRGGRVLISLAILGTIAMNLVYTTTAFAEQTTNPQPKAQIVNSKYLTIKDPKFRNESFSNSITGTIINNST